MLSVPPLTVNYISFHFHVSWVNFQINKQDAMLDQTAIPYVFICTEFIIHNSQHGKCLEASGVFTVSELLWEINTMRKEDIQV